MNKLWTMIAAVSALVAAAPAAAQSWGGTSSSVQARVQQLQARLEAGIRRGTIPGSQAARLRSQAQQLRQLEWRYRSDGISSRERADLQMRIENLDSQIAYAERWGYRYQNEGQADRNNGWNGRDYNRGGRADDRSYDRGIGGYDADNDGRDRSGRLDYDPRYDQGDEVNRTPYDSYDDNDRRDAGTDDYGRYDRGAALRIGDRAPEDLNEVPPQYRAQFRDGNGVYFGYDDGVIYQIDARTNVILRLYPLGR